MLLFTGALTSKPYAFTARPWELRSVESIDILDGLGSNIRIDFKESEILRILPRRNSEINEYWISDKIRFFYDSLKRQRLTTPYEKNKGDLKKIKWSSLFLKLSSIFKVYTYEFGNQSVGIITGTNLDSETLFSLRNFSNRFGFKSLGIEKAFILNIDNSVNYRFFSPIQTLEDADFCLFVGTNPRFEASVLNLRFRKIFKRGTLRFASIGGNYSTTFPISSYGLTTKTLVDLAEGKHALCKQLAQAKNPFIIYGSKLLEREDGRGLSFLLKSLTKSLSLYQKKDIFPNNLILESNSVGGFELGFQPFQKKSLKNIKLLYCVGLENFENITNQLPKNLSTALLLQTSHGNTSTKKADFILPSLTFAEKTGIYYNLEGRPQKTQRALVGPNLAREDWKIIRAFFDVFHFASSYQTKSELLNELSKLLPSSSYPSTWLSIRKDSFFGFEFLLKTRISKSYLKLTYEDFYMDNSLCQSSRIMAKASEFLRLSSTNYKFLTYISLK